MAADKRSSGAGEPSRSLTELLVARVLEPFGVVMLTRERISETLEEAVERGRVTRTDANELTGELLRRGRLQTEELLGEVERLLEGGRGRLESAGRRTGLTSGVSRLADRARRTVSGGEDSEGGGPPIAGYERLTARQVQARLGGLTPGQLRRLAEHERRHANRKTVLEAVERLLA